MSLRDHNEKIAHESYQSHEQKQKGTTTMSEIILKEESYRIIGACFEVYNEKGNGFTEPVYQECLSLSWACRAYRFKRRRLYH